MPDLHWEEYKEVESGDAGLFVSTVSTPEHTLAEGLVASFIGDVKNAVDLLWDAVGACDHEKASALMEPTYHIVRFELEKAVETLQEIPRQKLRPKHRDCRAMMNESSRRLSKNSPLNFGGLDPGPFIKEVTTLLPALHQCLLEQTKKKKRLEVRRGYKRG